MLAEGGVAEFARRNAAKAALVYGAIDGSGGFYRNEVAHAARSRMNIPFFLPDAELDARFVAEAKAAGLLALKGHKVVGASVPRCTTPCRWPGPRRWSLHGRFPAASRLSNERRAPSGACPATRNSDGKQQIEQEGAEEGRTGQGQRAHQGEGQGQGRLEPGADPGALALADVRSKIDQIDRDIQSLIAERARFAHQVGKAKGKLAAVDYYRPEREAQVLRMVVDRNEGPLSDELLVHVYREIMSACLAQQEPLKIGYLGPEGTFSQQAVLKHFGRSALGLPMASIEEVFQEVEAGNADFGVVPVENSGRAPSRSPWTCS